MSETFVEIQIPHQKVYNGVQFPSVLYPNHRNPFPLPILAQAVRNEKPLLDSLLLNSGALLFRGFPVKTASDFNEFVEAFGFEELPYVGGAAPRANIVGRVFTANESPPDQKIPFHHEMAQVCSLILSHIFVGKMGNRIKYSSLIKELGIKIRWDF